MIKIKKLLKIILLIIVVILALVVVNGVCSLDAQAQSFTPDENQGFVGDFASNEALKDMQSLTTPNCTRPETVIVHDGWVYGSFHGQIARMREDGSDYKIIVDTKGETLGFNFDPEGNLVFTDIKYNGTEPGVYKVDPNAESPEVTKICSEIGGVPLKCPDALTVASDGTIYFTDACQFSALDYENAENAASEEFWYHTRTGKVFSYNPVTHEGKELASGFSFANGIALSEDESSLYLAETMAFSIWEINVNSVNSVKDDNLNGSEDGNVKLLIGNLPGYPDNIVKGEDGRYWVGLVNVRGEDESLLSQPILRTIILMFKDIRVDSTNIPPGFAGVFAFNKEGNITEFLMYPETNYTKTTGAFETNNRLYIHSNSLTGTINYIEK